MALRIYGNRPLKTLPGLETRPTAAKVRQALFNIWQGRLEGSRWLDLCAGSGALGAEALCRGAQSVAGVDSSGAVCRLLQSNWTRLAAPGQTVEILRGDVLKILPRLPPRQFDLIYFDPPYAGALYSPVLEAISETRILAPTGELAVEHDCNFTAPLEIQGLSQRDQKRYGKTLLSFYQMTDISFYLY